VEGTVVEGTVVGGTVVDGTVARVAGRLPAPRLTSGSAGRQALARTAALAARPPRSAPLREGVACECGRS
ncbi:MAG: hypothetical protein WD029_02890, partial [Microthrixaceae bacterium]